MAVQRGLPFVRLQKKFVLEAIFDPPPPVALLLSVLCWLAVSWRCRLSDLCARHVDLELSRFSSSETCRSDPTAMPVLTAVLTSIQACTARQGIRLSV